MTNLNSNSKFILLSERTSRGTEKVHINKNYIISIKKEQFNGKLCTKLNIDSKYCSFIYVEESIDNVIKELGGEYEVDVNFGNS
jgi:hypothetical protein